MSVKYLALYGISTYLPSLIMLGSIYVFTRMLSPTEYGYFALWMAVILTVASTVMQWLRQALLRYWKEYERVGEARRLYATVVLLTVAVCAVTLGLAGLAYPIARQFLPDQMLVLYTIGAGAIVVFVVATIQLTVWQAALTPGLFALARVVIAVVTFGASIALLTLTPLPGAAALSLGFLFGYATAVGLGLIADRERSAAIHKLVGQADRQVAQHLWHYGWPFVGWFIGTQLLSFADRFILGVLGSVTAAGVYSASYMLLNGMVSMLTTPLVTAAHPAIAAAWCVGADSSEARAVLQGYVKLYLLVTLPMLAGLLAVGQFASGLVLATGYAPDTWLVIILAVGLFANTFSLLSHKGLEMAEQTGRMFGLIVVCAAVNIGLCIVLIPILGMHGAAWATLTSYVLYAALTMWMSQRHLKLSVSWRSLLHIGGASAAVYLVACGVFEFSSALGPWLRLLVTALSGALVYVCLLLAANEIPLQLLRLQLAKLRTVVGTVVCGFDGWRKA